MLKKMMALLVAISCAFGAWADVTGHLSGTDFSPLSAGSFVTGLDDNGESTGSTYWFTGDPSDFEGTIVTNALEEKFLDFESNITNPLYRTISGCWGATSPAGFVTNSIGTGLFIDTHVQFTPYLVNENHPEPTKVTAEDKLIVWVRETEVDGDANITNLIVTAGYWTAEPAVVASNYVSTLSSADVSALCAGTHRLTIKSFENILSRTDRYIMGFVVYIDQTPIQYIGDAFETGCTYLSTLASTPRRYYEQGGSQNKLFPSLLNVGTDSTPIAEYSVLSGVGYAGMGKIGDVIFDTYQTDYPSFAADDLSFEVVLEEGVAGFSYLGESYTTGCTFSVAASTPSVTISNVTYATGYKHKTGTWHNNVSVDNQVGVGGDYGTFIFANGTTLTLAGFKPNYLVVVGGVTNEFQSLYGEDGALAAALLGGTLILNSNIVIDEEAGCVMIDEGKTLVLDLNGYTIQGTTESFGTIANLDGTLTVIDTSLAQTGKVLPSTETGISLYAYNGSTTLNAGEYGLIRFIEDDSEGGSLTAVINGGTYYDPDYNPDPEDPEEEPVTTFYLQTYVADGKTVSWNKVGDDWYATVGGSVVIPCDVTFSTNNVVVAEWSQVVNSGDALTAAKIPDVSGLTGSWDAPAPTAESVISSDTNFNFTVAAPVVTYAVTFSTNTVVVAEWTTNIVAGAALGDAIPDVSGLTGAWDVTPTAETVINEATNFNFTISYRLTYASDHGAVPDGVVYTASTPDFALAAAPDPGVVGIAFAGWVIGTVTNEAGATYVVADHLENTTATAAWVALAPPAYFPQSDIDPSSPYAGRDGTPAKPFVIRNLADLEAFKTYVEDGTFASSSFEVVSNITGVTDWVGVGTDSTMFSGTLNGGGKTIDVTFAAGTKYNGLFRFVNNATISNLTVNVTAGAVSGSTGGAAFVGKAYGSCTFAELKATGSLGTSVTPITHNAASMVVSLNGNGGAFNFNNCTNEMAIYANYTKVGGLVAFREGSNNSEINFNNCVNSASINNISDNAAECSGTGGLMGWTGYANPSKITVNGCASIGSVTAANGTASSIVGYKSASPVLTGVNTVLASLKPSGTSTIGGCDWATVDGDIATFVTPVASVDSVVAYKVMQANSSPNFTLADPDAALTIDSSLAAYSGTVSVASALAEDYDLRQTAILNGTIYSLESKTPADPWAPAEQTDEAASNKVVEIFGEGSDVANHTTTLAEYGNLVAYITNVTSEATVPSDLTGAQKAWMWKSFILGANPLFDTDVAVEITSLTANSEAGKWDFTVKVTEGESTDAYNVAADKVAALVKIRTSLTTGTWVTPTAGNIEAIKLLGGNLIKVTVNFGDGASGFMKVSE